MKSLLKHATGGLALALGLGAGCGFTPAPAASEPSKVEASIEQSLDRLRALQTLEVGGLVMILPAEATSCYGVPCAGSAWVQPYRDEQARQAPRLEKLAVLAEETRHNAYLTPHDKSETAAAIEALNALQIVSVGALITVQPKNSLECYNLPCPADVQAADQENAKRVTEAFGIVDAARRTGL